MAIGGFLTVVILVGPVLDTCSLFLGMADVRSLGAMYLSGLPVNLTQGLSTALTLALIGPALLEKLDRVKLQYGMGGGNGV